MVKPLVRFCLLGGVLFMAVCFSAACWAASLTVEADRPAVYKGESLTLSIILSDAQQAASPDLSPLEKDFQIVSRSQSSSVNMINGSFSAKTIWTLTLIPKRTGVLRIPSMSVQTGTGILQSQPVEIQVSTGASPVAKRKGRDVYVTGEVSAASPALNSPVVFVARLVAAKPVYEISHGDLKIEDAIVEKQGDPKIFETTIDGRPVRVVELRYLITPLKPGRMTVPAYVFQGMISGASGGGGSRFGAQDPLGIFQDFGMFADIMGQPFTLMTDEVQLDVQDAQPDIDPWIPAEGLQISDVLEGEKGAKAGEPITRRLTQVVSGNTGEILPSLESQAAPEKDFTVYADSPEKGINVSPDGKKVTGWREETYTLVPRHGGKLVLPEIKVAWWDTRSQTVRYATAAARTIEVSGPPPAPDAEPAPTEAQEVQSSGGFVPPQVADVQALGQAAFTNIYVVGVVALLLGLASLWIFLSFRGQKKPVIRQPLPRTPDIEAPANQNEQPARRTVSLNDLRNAKDGDELKSLLLLYAGQIFGTGSTLSLKAAAQDFSKGIDPDRRRTLDDAVRRLEALLYAGAQENFERIRSDLVSALEGFRPPKRDGSPKVRLGSLNPS